MHLYVQNAKTTYFRPGGDRWFRACWEVSQSLINAENSAATRFCESLKIVTLLKVIFEFDKESYYHLKIAEKRCCAAALFRFKNVTYVDK